MGKGNGGTILAVSFTALLFSSCAQQEKCLTEEVRICNLSSSSAAGSNEIKLSEVFNFKWDELYIVTGPRLPDDISQMIGRDYEGIIPDDSRQYIFVENGVIVRDARSSCPCLDYFDETHKSGFVKYTRSSSISILCKTIEGEVICTVQSLRTL
jgi:hypothetical protein